MKRGYLVAVALAFVVLGPHVRAQDGNAAKAVPALTAEQQLKAENFRLKVEVAQLKATLADRESRLASAALSDEQVKLAAEFVAAMGGAPGDTWDWQTMTLKRAAKPEPKKE
jgi:hypothetical protein